MTATAQTFRGYRAICEVVERMEVLAAWFKSNRPDDFKSLTLARRDLDLLQRWPKAAALHQIYTNDGVTYWHGLTLRADKTTSRYVRGAE